MKNSITQLPKAIQTLTQYTQWVGWSYWLDDQNRPKKLPCNPLTGTKAMSNNPKTWGTYQQAIDSVKKYGFEGIGFMFYPQNIPLVGIDLDNCLDDNGNPSKLAQDVIDLIGGYWEISPSGKGLHGLVLGQLPTGKRKNAKMGFEMYESGRYFTITGNQFVGSELVECTDKLSELHAMIFTSSARIPPNPTPKTAQKLANFDDFINKAMNAKNGAKFKALWEGNISGYPSPSEAEFALASMLAYWTDYDEAQIDSYFRQSELMRDKWDEPHGDLTYGQLTIRNAIAKSQSYGSSSPKSVSNREVKGQVVEVETKQNPVVVTTELAKNEAIETENKGFSLTSEDIHYLVHKENDSDEGNAQCVIKWYAKKHRALFLHTKHYGWMYYTGTHWESEDADYKVQKAVLDTIRYRFLAAVSSDSPKAKAFKPSSAVVNSTVALLKILCNANVSHFDNDPDKLNVLNGVIDLRTGELQPHDPKQRFTYCIQTAYNSQACYKAWKNHVYKTFIPEHMLAEAMGELSILAKFGEQTIAYVDLVNYIQTVFGYTMTGRANEEIMFYIHGETRAGKGVLFQALSKLLGKPFAMAVALSSLTRKRTGNDQNFDLAPLKPARFVTVSESDSSKGSSLNEAAIKGITGQDPIKCCFKGKDHFEYIPYFKIWMASNAPIKANADDNAMWQRVKILHAPNSFAGREDTQLKDRLMSPIALEGVLRWLVEGSKKWYKFYDQGIKLPTPIIVQQATTKARTDNDVLGLFIEDNCIVGEEERVPLTQFYNLYKDWCHENGYTPKMSRSLNDSMEGKGFIRKAVLIDGKTVKCWVGLRLNTEKLDY